MTLHDMKLLTSWGEQTGCQGFQLRISDTVRLLAHLFAPFSATDLVVNILQIR